MTRTPDALVAAREQFLAMVAGVRPELHRYCARLTGSVIEGEDIVQDALAKAFYALTLSAEVPPLRPWLFRIAHNAALDFLRSHGRKYTEPHAELEDIAGFEDAPDPYVVRAALARFLSLPVTQRSAVILKDVLGHSLEETAETMGTTVMAVKAALVRGRGPRLGRRARPRERRLPARPGLQVAATRQAGRDVLRSIREASVQLRVVQLEGQLALAAHVGGAEKPRYFVLLEFEQGRVSTIRDFRYVPYIARGGRIRIEG